jgi:hypothetical protein
VEKQQKKDFISHFGCGAAFSTGSAGARFKPQITRISTDFILLHTLPLFVVKKAVSVRWF